MKSVDPSPFEIGLVFWWKRTLEPAKPPYANKNYGRSSAVSALASALEGFSAHRSWSSIFAASEMSPTAGATVDSSCCTRKFTGGSGAYAISGYAYETAMKAFDPVIDIVQRSSSDEKLWNEVRELWLEGFNRFRQDAFKQSSGGVDELPASTTQWWERIDFGPVIASLGVFTHDGKAHPGAPKRLYVQIARGPSGLALPLQSGEKNLEIWQPNTYLVVAETPLTTTEWEKLVQERGL